MGEKLLLSLLNAFVPCCKTVAENAKAEVLDFQTQSI